MSGRHYGYAIGLALMALGAVGCGPPMGTLTEGVAGPFGSSYFATDLTTLQTGDFQVSYLSNFYVQAVVNSVLNGDIVTATMNDAKSVSFTSTQDGDVGLSFEFERGSNYWTKGKAFVTVVHGQRGIGRIDFTIQ